MNKLFYPAIFHTAEEGGFWVSFPDLPECITEGDDMEQAYMMAVDALGLALTSRKKENQPVPGPSDPYTIHADSGGFLVVIQFNMEAVSQKIQARLEGAKPSD